MRWDIINHLIKEHNYKSYLEIGYYKGWSFDRVECESKTWVDPNPSKTENQVSDLYGTQEHHAVYIDRPIYHSFKLTSDDFFLGMSESIQWDIIFIDGLHEAQQVDRDIQNALKHLSPSGTIVLHDLNPPTYLHTTTGDAAGNWNGDCYKSVINIQAYTGVELYTVDTDWGIGILRPKEDTTWIPFCVMKYDGTWEYFDKHRKELLNLISVEEFLQREKINE